MMQQKNSRQFLFELCKRTLYNTTRRNNMIVLNMSGSYNMPQLMQQPTFTCHDCDLIFNDIFAFLEHSYEQNSFDSIDALKVPFTEDKFCKICLTYKKTRYALIYHIARHLEEAYTLKMPTNFNNQNINDRSSLQNQSNLYRNNNDSNRKDNNMNRNENYNQSRKYQERFTESMNQNQTLPMQFNSKYLQSQSYQDQIIIHEAPCNGVRSQENQNVASRDKGHFIIPIPVKELKITACAPSTVVTSECSSSPGNLVIDDATRSGEDSGCVEDLNQSPIKNPVKDLHVTDKSKAEEISDKYKVPEKQQVVEKKKEYFKEMQRCKRIQCKFCQRSFHRQSDIVKHMNKYDTKCVVNLTCGTCARVYRSRKLFEKHKDVCKKQYLDEPMTHLCDLCGQAYARPNFLTAHLKHGHDKVQCTYCDKMYKDETALKAHVSNVHFN